MVKDTDKNREYDGVLRLDEARHKTLLKPRTRSYQQRPERQRPPVSRDDGDGARVCAPARAVLAPLAHVADA